MINSENSELKQIVWGNIPSNVYFPKEGHVQMFSGACPRHITKAMLRVMLRAMLRVIGKMRQKYDKIAKTLEYLMHKHFLFKMMTQMPRFHLKPTELQAQL